MAADQPYHTADLTSELLSLSVLCLGGLSTQVFLHRHLPCYTVLCLTAHLHVPPHAPMGADIARERIFVFIMHAYLLFECLFECTPKVYFCYGASGMASGAVFERCAGLVLRMHYAQNKSMPDLVFEKPGSPREHKDSRSLVSIVGCHSYHHHQGSVLAERKPVHEP